MYYNNFLPLWYRIKREKEIRIMLLGINLILIVGISIFALKIKLIKKEIAVLKEEIICIETINSSNQNKKHRQKLIEAFNGFINDLDNEFIYDKVEFIDDEIFIELNLKSDELLKKLINDIENNSKYKIKNLNMIEDDNKGKGTELCLEVKK